MEAGGEAATKVPGSRAPRFVRRSRPLHLTWQIGVALVGFAVMAAGAAMLVLPGPGWAAIFVGLAILGTEFVWAQRALIWTKDQAGRAARRALDPRSRRRNLLILALGMVLLAGAAVVWVWRVGLAVPF